MNTTRGFTLIEVVIASGIAVCGLLAVTSIFSYAVQTNWMNREMAVATSLLYDKMEQFRGIPFAHPSWANLTGSEIVNVAGDAYQRTWKIVPGVPRTVTVVIYVQRHAVTRRRAELVRATTLVSPTF